MGSRNIETRNGGKRMALKFNRRWRKLAKEIKENKNG
jgi:hypothetical protein